jgi:putative ABC transport system permease protein
MFFNYIKAAIRSLLKQKGQTIIGIISLTGGLICSIIISLWLRGELSYDKFHDKAERTYRVIHDESKQTPMAFGLYVKENFPEVLDAARLNRRFWQITHEGNSFMGRVFCADPSFLDIFTYRYISGDSEDPLGDPYSIVLTENLAIRLFGDEDPIGKTIAVEGRQPLIVTAVIEDVPFNSHMRFDAITQLYLMNIMYSWFETDESWTGGDLWTYILLHENASPSAVRDKIQQLAIQIDPDVNITLEPLTDIHLLESQSGASLMTYVYIWSGAAILILLSACINYINLSTARSLTRAREVGVRKAIGANRMDLVRQFMSETMIITFISMLLAVALIELLLPAFSSLAGRPVSFSLIEDPILILSLFGIVILTGIIAGFYPAIALSAFKPVKVLRNAPGNGTGKSLSRKILVVVQFSVSIFLLTAVAVVYSQMKFIQSKDLGYDYDKIVYVDLNGSIYNHLGAIYEDLDKNPSIVSYTGTNTTLDEAETTTDNVSWEGQQDGQEVVFRALSIGYNFMDVYGAEMIEGRFFSRDFATDSEEGYIVNQAAVAAMGMTEPIGKRFTFEDRQGRIIGVIKDFNYRSLHYEVQPLVIGMFPWADNLAIKINAENTAEVVSYIAEVILTHVPDYPLVFNFLEDEIAANYRSETQMGKIFSIAALMAVLMSCLGLLGLTSYSVTRRTKEIGIRKVLGASISNVVRLISKEFVFSILLACLIAWPLAWYAAERWLENFAFTISLSWEFFVLSAVLTLVIAMLTASYHALKAALTNPVSALRHE